VIFAFYAFMLDLHTKTLHSKLSIVNGNMVTKEDLDANFKTTFSNYGSISNGYDIDVKEK